jgi:predicted SAM-dependent methyltransferase
MKLNLGCGKTYKPGYLNVDSCDTSVADRNWDILDLQLKDESADLIEVDQVIEHFDWVNVRYLLAEFWRVLKSGGSLIIETPDLLGSMKKLKKAQGEEFLIGSQWLFGIGTKGQRHGMVFKDKELKGMLMGSGFEDIEFHPQKTYPSEPGLRVECRKGKSEGRRKVETLFRKRVRKVYDGDSYLLIPVEDHMNELYFSLTVDGEPREPIFTENLFKAALADPEVPGQLLLSMKAYRKGIEMTDELMDALRFMHEEQMKGRAFTLWMKRRKGPDVRKSFERFFSETSEKMRYSLLRSTEPRKDLLYILSLQPTDLRMLDFRIISDRAKEWSNQGIRSFHNKDIDSAKEHMERALAVINTNPITHWNIARILYVQDKRADALKRMDRVIKLLTDKELAREAKREQEMMRRGALDPESLGPKAEIFV